jgi:hypothetical protein
MTGAGFGQVLPTNLDTGDLVSMAIVSMLTASLIFSAVVSFLSKFYTPATILFAVALTISALETIISISLTNS